MPRLKRPAPEPVTPAPPPAVPAAIPWALAELLESGPVALAARERVGSAVALVLPPGAETPRAAGVPPELLSALAREGVDLTIVADDEVDDRAEPIASADVVLAAGWAAVPAVLMAEGARARAVLPAADAPPLAELGWAEGALPVLGPAWLGGELPAGADAAYVPKPVHRREDLVLVHGEEPFGLLAAALLAERRDNLTFAVTGVRDDLALPFRFLGVEPGPEALAHAFASATVAIAPSVRGWRPAGVAMLACGQAVVAPDDAPTRAALGDAASYARGPLEAAAAVEAFLADPDYALRAERARAGFALVPGGWSSTAASLAAHLRAL
jgi:hypothetical protein